jgi:hypothetical protein
LKFSDFDTGNLPATSRGTLSGTLITQYSGTTTKSERPPPQPGSKQSQHETLLLSLLSKQEPTTQPNKPVIIATVDESFLARPASAIVYDGLHADTISNREAVRNLLPDFCYRPAELVPERQRDRLAGDGVRCRRAERRAAKELVEVTRRVLAKNFPTSRRESVSQWGSETTNCSGEVSLCLFFFIPLAGFLMDDTHPSANPAPRGLDLDLALPAVGLGHLLVSQVLFAVEPHGIHHLPRRSSHDAGLSARMGIGIESCRILS